MKTPIQAPILQLALCFGAGIFLHESLDVWAVYFSAALSLLFLLLITFARRIAGRQFEKAATLCISLLFLFLGTLFYKAHTFSPIQETLSNWECTEGIFAGKVISERKKTPFGFQAWVELEAVQKDSLWVRAQGKFQLYLKPTLDSLFEEGDTVTVRSYIKPVLVNGKSYNEYLLSKGIRHLAYADVLRVKSQKPGFSTQLKAYQRILSHKIGQQIQDSVLASLAQAMFLGDKRYLTKESRAIFASAGLSHMIAISGMHVGIVFLCLNLIFLPLQLLKHGKRIKQSLILLFLLVYMLLTGASPAVVRAVLMLAIVLMFRMLYQKYDLINLLAIAGFLQMLYNPTIVFQVGFQLSYAAVLGLLVFMPMYQKYTETPYKWLNILTGWVGVSIIATCCTAPLSIFYFEQFPVYFLISNILASTIAFGLIFSGFLWILCMAVPVLGDLFAAVCEFFLWLLALIASEVSQLPFALLQDFLWSQTGLQIICFELLFAAFLILLPRLYFHHKMLPT